MPASPDDLAPGAVYWIELEGADGLSDAVVVASGSNSILVYKTLAVDPQTGAIWTTYTDGKSSFAKSWKASK